jgi:hypothetical protein
VAREVRTRGRNVLALPGDVNDFDHLALVVQQALSEFGRLETVLDNADGSTYERFLGTTVEELEIDGNASDRLIPREIADL